MHKVIENAHHSGLDTFMPADPTDFRCTPEAAPQNVGTCVPWPNSIRPGHLCPAVKGLGQFRPYRNQEPGFSAGDFDSSHQRLHSNWVTYHTADTQSNPPVARKLLARSDLGPDLVGAGVLPISDFSAPTVLNYSSLQRGDISMSVGTQDTCDAIFPGTSVVDYSPWNMSLEPGFDGRWILKNFNHEFPENGIVYNYYWQRNGALGNTTHLAGGDSRETELTSQGFLSEPALVLNSTKDGTEYSTSGDTSSKATSAQSEDPSQNDRKRRHYTCSWRASHGTCNTTLLESDFSAHLRTCHVTTVPRDVTLSCRWVGCSIRLKKESLLRHIWEKHLERGFPCSMCPQRFTRNYTRRIHQLKMHNGN